MIWCWSRLQFIPRFWLECIFLSILFFYCWRHNRILEKMHPFFVVQKWFKIVLSELFASRIVPFWAINLEKKSKAIDKWEHLENQNKLRTNEVGVEIIAKFFCTLTALFSRNSRSLVYFPFPEKLISISHSNVFKFNWNHMFRFPFVSFCLIFQKNYL